MGWAGFIASGSLIFCFFQAQSNNPTKGDWILNVKKIITDIALNMTFEEISEMKTHIFKKIVDTKVKKVAVQYLVSKIKSKGKELSYGNMLKCQGYLMPNNTLTLQEQRAIFSYRSRMNNLKYNYSGTNILEKCQCGKDMTNPHLYECTMLNQSERNVEYSRIFNGRLCEMKYIIDIQLKYQNIHERFTQAQDIIPLSH
jgi:hypothetical protein